MTQQEASRLGSYSRHGEVRFTESATEYRPFLLMLTEEEEGGYSVVVPELPGVASQGVTIDDAVRMASEAIEAALSAYRRRGQEPPVVELAEDVTLGSESPPVLRAWTLG